MRLAGLSLRRTHRSRSRDNRDAQIRRMWPIAYSRAPTAEDIDLARRALDDPTREWTGELTQAGKIGADQIDSQARRRVLENFCHAVLNSAEFIFVD